MLDDIQLDGEYFDESYFAFYEDLDIGYERNYQAGKPITRQPLWLIIIGVAD